MVRGEVSSLSPKRGVSGARLGAKCTHSWGFAGGGHVSVSENRVDVDRPDLSVYVDGHLLADPSTDPSIGDELLALGDLSVIRTFRTPTLEARVETFVSRRSRPWPRGSVLVLG